MLNKKICKKCSKQNTNQHRWWGWDTIDEQLWNLSHEVECACEAKRLSTKNNPPENCPYLLEHVLSDKKDPSNVK